VSIKMAKEQNLSLTSSKISGNCGRLMCCLSFEQKVYEMEYATFPKVDSLVETPQGRGVICESNFLTGKIKVKLMEIDRQGRFNLSRKDIYICSVDKVEMPEGAPIINNVENLVKACLDNGRDPLKYLAARKSRWVRSVIIVNDISCGLVPMDAEDRAYREAVGRTSMYLAQEALAVVRVFAGIGKRIK
jgi:hypothetical protein